MDSTVESLEKAYEGFIGAAARVLEARESSDAAKTPNTDAALENFKQHWELLRVACDRAEQLVESVRQRIGSECLVDEATGGSSSARAGQTAVGIPPISAVRLEQMSKAVRWLVIDLQQGGGGGASSNNPANATAASLSSLPSTGAPSGATAGFDARFGEDAVQ
jgi:hypothetical protein